MAFLTRDYQRAQRLELGRKAIAMASEGKSGTEIALALGCSRTQLYKAVREVRAMLENIAPEVQSMLE